MDELMEGRLPEPEIEKSTEGATSSAKNGRGSPQVMIVKEALRNQWPLKSDTKTCAKRKVK